MLAEKSRSKREPSLMRQGTQSVTKESSAARHVKMNHGEARFVKQHQGRRQNAGAVRLRDQDVTGPTLVSLRYYSAWWMHLDDMNVVAFACRRLIPSHCAVFSAASCFVYSWQPFLQQGAQYPYSHNHSCG